LPNRPWKNTIASQIPRQKTKETSMNKSLKLCFAAFLLTLSLTTFGLAGEGQCPLIDPPPPPDNGNGRMTAPVIQMTNPSEADGYQVFDGIWEFLLLKEEFVLTINL
jgi:hypothetical protein